MKSNQNKGQKKTFRNETKEMRIGKYTMNYDIE